MANRTDPTAATVHGTNPQVRDRRMPRAREAAALLHDESVCWSGE